MSDEHADQDWFKGRCPDSTVISTAQVTPEERYEE
jgi:hypothetical protein